MLYSFWLLLVLYIGLILLYASTKMEPMRIPPWPQLSIDTPSENITLSCQNNSDCPKDFVCLKNQCIPKFLKGAQCNATTGQWISYLYRGVHFAICACLNSNLVTQKYFGGNCDVDVGCGIHGKYNAQENKCECDPGYTPIDGFSCQKLPVVDRINIDPCEPNEIENLSTADGFHAHYVRKLFNLIKCVKQPCKFDALNGRPLKHGRFLVGWGCVCDPRFGLFGVQLEGQDKKYLSTPGFDACASIFQNEDPPHPIDVKLITYFYLGEREPISLILFPDSVDQNQIIPMLKDQFPLMVTQKLWQYDYAQHFFETKQSFRTRTRQIDLVPVLMIETVHEWNYRYSSEIIDCHEISNHLINQSFPRPGIYHLLYKNPVCRVQSGDSHSDPMFWEKVIVNPLHVTFQDHPHLQRFNAFVLEYNGNLNRWTLDLDHEYKIDHYRSTDTNAPFYQTKIMPHVINAYIPLTYGYT